MSPPEETTWLQYYQAVKQGDLKTVQHSGKNFRLPLTLNLSALQLAAAYGHVELVRFFLTQCNEEYDRNFVLGAAENAQYECAKLLIGHAEPLSEQEMVDYAASMIQNGDMDCVRLIDVKLLSSLHRSAPQIVQAAICSGSTESVRFVYKLYEDIGVTKAETSCTTIKPTPEIWFVIILEELRWKLESYKKGDAAYFETYQCEGFDFSSTSMSLSAFDIAAYFGEVDMLKLCIQAADSKVKTRKTSARLGKELESVMEMALHNNRVNVVKYLIENKFVKPKPPYDYDDFRFNDAFEYLWKKTKRHVPSGELPKRLTECWNEYRRYESNFNSSIEESYDGPFGTRKNIIDAEKHFKSLLEICDEICPGPPGGYGNLFIDMLSMQNVEAALCLKSAGNLVLPDPKQRDDRLKKALRCYTNDGMEVLPSLVTVELALTNLKTERNEYRFVDYLFESWPEFENARDEDQPLAFLTEGTDALLALLMKHGHLKPDYGDLLRTMYSFFESKEHVQPLWAARLLTLMRCRQIWRFRIYVEKCAHWFLEMWAERDYFLTEFLLALGSNDQHLGEIQFCGLLAYFLEPELRTDHFINVLAQTRLEIDDDDSFLSEDTEEMPSYPAVRKAFDPRSSNRLPSLQSQCRLAIHVYSLEVAAEDDHRFISARSIVKNMSLKLPKLLREYLLYSDIHQMNKELKEIDYDPWLIEDIVDSEYYDRSDQWDGASHQNEADRNPVNDDDDVVQNNNAEKKARKKTREADNGEVEPSSDSEMEDEEPPCDCWKCTDPFYWGDTGPPIRRKGKRTSPNDST